MDLLPLTYRRPAHVEKPEFLDSQASLHNDRRSSDSLKPVDLCGTMGIPSALSFDRIMDGGTCPPCTIRDFMNYLLYVERSAENLQFFLWNRDYATRFAAAKTTDISLAPEWTQTMEDEAVARIRKEHAEKTRKAPKGVVDFFKGTDFEKGGGDATRKDSVVSVTETCSSPASQAFTSAGVKAPFTIQPFRKELDRVIASYIMDGAPRQLNLSDSEQKAVLEALSFTTHPSAFRLITRQIEATLRQQAHPNFIRWSICNGNPARAAFARGLGAGTVLIGIVVAVILTLSSAGRGYRALAAIGWMVGFATLMAAYKGMPDGDDEDDAVGVSKRSFNSFGAANSYEDQPWVVRYRKRNVVRKIFDREVWVEEPALRQIQDTIFVQSILFAFLCSAVLTALFPPRRHPEEVREQQQQQQQQHLGQQSENGTTLPTSTGRPRTATADTTEIDETLSHPGSVRINVKGAFIVDQDTATPTTPDGRSGSPGRHETKDIRLPNHTAVLVYFSREAHSTEPGGRLNFNTFETDRIDDCLEFMRRLKDKHLALNGTASNGNGSGSGSSRRGANELCVMATGGGAYKFYDKIRDMLGVDVLREDEMECLIIGLDFFITEIPREVFTYSETNPMHFVEPPENVYPYLLVNIGSGVSFLKVSGPRKYERVGGTSLGGGTLWGLLSLLTGARTFDEMLDLASQGDNAKVDMLVGDIYGTDYGKIGLKSTTIASSFGKVFRKKRQAEQEAEDSGGRRHKDKQHPHSPPFSPADISVSLLYAISNNIGQIAFLQSQIHGLSHIYFGGSFIRGHLQTMNTLSYAIKFWSKGAKQAYFLRHEGYLGAVGAFLKRQPINWGRRGSFDDLAVLPPPSVELRLRAGRGGSREDAADNGSEAVV
ncbi:fumble-domain-containing protein [Chaetomidium leptoderma]|uniref:Fumble-domain-containing protein n=1 Tax=Chaetomidium leptoderma TaxID=669021 RepID=A0AAN6VHC4_9PEZI|nr:fumble-domain-containing protein [Chaetomidium leptoderma]